MADREERMNKLFVLRMIFLVKIESKRPLLTAKTDT
jgi:hypothetical protein